MKFFFLSFFLLLCCSVQVFAQVKKPKVRIMAHADTVSVNKRDTDVIEHGVKQRDMGDVLRGLFKKAPAPPSDSVSTKAEISVIPAIGYTLTTGLAVVLTGNVAFRTGPKSRISTIIASGDYSQKHQLTIPVQTSIWTHNNTWNLLGEYKYFKYPQSTYGLGSSSGIENEDPMDYIFVRLYQGALRRVSNSFYLGGGYIFDTRWHISE